MNDNQTTPVLFAGVNVTQHVTAIRDEHAQTTIEQAVERMVEDLKKLGNLHKVKFAQGEMLRLMGMAEYMQEIDDNKYRHINYNLVRNYRNLVIEQMVEAMDAWNEFIDFPEFQLGVINMSYEFDITSDDLKNG